MRPFPEPTEVRTLRQLDRVPTAPFYEAAVLRYVEAAVRHAFPDDPRLRYGSDGCGNLAVRFAGSRSGAESPVLAYVAHADHPALHVSVGSDGRLVGTVRGGLDRTVLPGAEVALHALEFPAFEANARVVDASEPADESSSFVLEPSRSLSPDEIREVTFASLDVGPLEVANGVLRAAVLDDYAGIAMMLEALSEIARADMPISLYLVFHRAEEVGFIGACGAALEEVIPEDALVYSIEMSSYLARRGDDERVPLATPGAGPVIRTGDRATPAYDLEALCSLREAALANPDLSVQQRFMWGGACEASLYYAFGYRAAGICLPLLSAHNNGRAEGREGFVREGVNLSDLTGGTRLLVALARTVADRPELFRHLGDHAVVAAHEELRKRVEASLQDCKAQGLI